MSNLKTAFNSIILLIFLILNGCATFEFTKSAPAQPLPINIQVTNEMPSKMSDLPLGYQIPDSGVFIMGEQKIGTAFGIIGISASILADEARLSQTVNDVKNNFKIELIDYLTTASKNLISEGYGEYFTQKKAPGMPTLLISPALILAPVDKKELLPIVLLKVNLLNTSGSDVWETRYFVSSGEIRPLVGDGSWSTNDAEFLKKLIQKNTMIAMETVFADLSKPFKRDEKNLVKVKGRFTYYDGLAEFVGYKVRENKDWLTFIPIFSDQIINTGVTVVDKSSVVFSAVDPEGEYKSTLEKINSK
jgi:hypothetical protein